MMNNKRLLFLTMVVLTLSLGVVIGTIVSGGVKATAEQKPATLVIPDPVSLSNGFSQIAALLEPAVVNITVEATAPTRARGRQQIPQFPGLPPGLFDFGDEGTPGAPRKATATGTGFIVDKAGFIVTNHHVVEKASKITVLLADKSKFEAKLIGSDEDTDLAVIKIEAGKDLATAKFGNSDAVKTGDWVLAIGSPFGFDHTVTSGIISAKGRDRDQFSGATGFQSFLQTDAAINPGNSGGPLVNMAGEVIGVNTAIVSETNSFAGLGFALPSNTALRVYNQLSQSGKVTRGSIGISYYPNQTPEMLSAFDIKNGEGVIVKEVLPNTPAAKAGLRDGDVITEIKGTKVTGGSSLLEIISNSPVGSSVPVKFLRDGRVQTASVTIGDRVEVLPRDQQAEFDRPDGANPRNGRGAQSRLGIQVQPIPAQLSQQFLLDHGVMISAVDAGSVAEEAELERGDVISEVRMGGRATPINDIGDFRRVEEQLKPGTAVALKIQSRNAQTNRYEPAGYVAMTVK